MRGRRGIAVVLAVGAIATVACTRSPAGTTTVTSGTYDDDPGACVCRLPQDEFMSCCRNQMELTCRCNGAWSCSMIPSGRTCGRAPPRQLR